LNCYSTQPIRSASAYPESHRYRGSMNGTALVGKASQIFRVTLHKLADVN
jgi:hypothetical protein